MDYYDQEFYNYISGGAMRSAEFIVPYLKTKFDIESVIDVGCGAGAWLAVWKKHQTEIFGIDGDHVNINSLYIDRNEFLSQDLRGPVIASGKYRKYSIAQSLEVAEHLPSEKADQFIESLCNLSDLILFSSAPPGQGGNNHINEQPYEYWRQKFADRKFIPLDLIRTKFERNKAIEKWYRYNSFVYVSETIFNALPESLKRFEIKDEIKDNSPVSYKIRKRFVLMLPESMVTRLAKIKQYFFLLIHRRTEKSTRL